MKRIFEIVSGVFSPLLTATYGVAMALLLSPIASYVATAQLVKVIVVVGIVTGVMPLAVLAGMCRAGVIKGGLDVPDRRERFVPYVTELVGLMLGWVYLYNASAPWWMMGFMIGGIIAVAVNMIVNRRWKISGHMAGMGALMGLTVGLTMAGVAASSNMMWWTMGMAMACAVVASARIYLKRHTPLQVLAGFVNGLVWTLVMTLI